MMQEQQAKKEDADIDQHARKTAGQRKINSIWEYTQSVIALSITFAKIYCSITKIESPELTNGFILVISIYLIRTNHHLIGGVGTKPQNEER